MKFLINIQRFNDLAKQMGWRTSATALADAMGISASYCRRVMIGQERLTEIFMLKYIECSGVDPKNPYEWACLFDIDFTGNCPNRTLKDFAHPDSILIKKHGNRLASIKSRCSKKNNPSYKSYGAKGVKCYLSIDDLEYLWNRDKAAFMRQPSLDRINSNGHYHLNNCRFMELIENIKRRPTKIV